MTPQDHSNESREDADTPASRGFAELPADARCRRCGYGLAGQIVSRCPECGEPFDPAVVRDGVVVRWSRLLALMVFACSLSVGSDRMTRPMWQLLLQPGPLRGAAGTMPAPAWTDWTWWLQWSSLLLAALGLVAAWGLWRRKDWGRKVLVGLLAVMCLRILALPLWAGISIDIQYEHYCVMGEDIANRYHEQSWQSVRDNFRSGIPEQVIPAGLVGWMIATGLRRRSLARNGYKLPPLVSRAAYSPMADWQGMLILLFLVAACSEIPAAHYPGRLLWEDWQVKPGTPWLQFQASLMVFRRPFVVISLSLIGAIMVWRKPDRIRALVMTLLLIMCTVCGLMIVDLLYSLQVIPQPSKSTFVVQRARGMAADLLPFLLVVFFAYTQLPRQELERIRTQRRRPDR